MTESSLLLPCLPVCDAEQPVCPGRKVVVKEGAALADGECNHLVVSGQGRQGERSQSHLDQTQTIISSCNALQ